MWHQWFNCNFTKLREYFLCAKKTKITTLFNKFVSSRSPYSTILESITYVNNVCCSVSAAPYVDTLFMLFTRTYVVYFRNTLQNVAIGWRGGDELLNKVIIFVFFAHKKYSRSFVKLRLNHWCHMDYFNDLLATFLSLDRLRILAVYERVRELSECIKNILICVLKMNEGLTGLERHEGE